MFFNNVNLAYPTNFLEMLIEFLDRAGTPI